MRLSYKVVSDCFLMEFETIFREAHNPDKQKKPHCQEGELWGKGFWFVLFEGGRVCCLERYITKLVRYVKKQKCPPSSCDHFCLD